MTDDERRQYLRLLRSHPEQYLRIAEETIRKFPGDIEGYSDCADYYIEMELYDEALHHLDQALAMDPEDAIIPFERATVLRRAGRYREALHAFDDFKEGERQFGDILHANRATCHAHLGDLDEALAECAKIADDYNLPSIYGEFGGSKRQIIDTVRRVAGAVRKDQPRG